MRKIFRSISKAILVVLILAVIFTGLLRNAYIQTYLARVTAIHLSEYLDSRVKIDKLRVSAFFTLHAKNIEINDLENKPLIFLKSIDLSTDIFKILKSDLALNQVEVDSASIFIRKYSGTNQLNIINILNKFIRADSLRPKRAIDKSRIPLAFKINKLEIKNSHFIYELEDEKAAAGFGIDYKDLDVQDFDANIRDIFIYNDSINAEIYNLSAFEKSGFQLNHLEGEILVCNKGIFLTEAQLETPVSNLEFDFNLTFPHWRSFKQFTDSVSLQGEIKSGDFNMSDISFFAPGLQGMNNQFKLSTTFNGPVANLRVRDLDLAFGNETNFEGNVQLTGLPEIFETFISLKVSDFSTSINDIQHFQLPGGRRIAEVPDLLTNFGKIQIRGNFTGFYNDFVSNARFQTNIGQLTTDIQFKNNPDRKITEYEGDFKARQFDLGLFLNQQDNFGKSDFDLKVKGEGLDLATLYANVKGQINSFEFKNNRLEDIAINGLFEERKFTGDITINDELIKADFQGHINFDTLVPIFDFRLKLEETHLAMLGILAIDSSAVFASDIKLNFSGNTFDNIRGQISLDSTHFVYKDEQYLMKNLQIRTSSNLANQRTISLKSDFMDGEIDGEFLLSEIKNTTVLFLHHYLPNLIYAPELEETVYTKNINWDIEFKNLSYILPLFHKPLQISENSKWVGKFDIEKNTIASQISLQNAVYQGIKLNNLQLKISNNKKNALNADLMVDEVIFKEEQKKDTLRLSIDNLRFSALAKNDSVRFMLDWKNKFEAIKNQANIDGFVSLSQKSNADIKFTKADLIINDTSWFIYPENHLVIEKDRFIFDKIGFYTASQLVEIAASYDQQDKQSLKIRFADFNVSNFNILLNSKGIHLDGLIDGDIEFINITKNIDFLADLKIENLAVNKEIIGNISLNSNRNPDQSIFVNAQIINIGDDNLVFKPLVLEGLYFPERKENSLDFTLLLDRIPAHLFQPLLHRLVDRMDGTASGKVLIKGKPEEPDLKGSVQLNEVGFRILYLNTDYKLTATANIDNSFIDLRNADFRDEMNNRAMLYGGLFHNHLKGFGVDLTIWPRNFMGLNTRRGMNPIFYGKAFASGTVEINGPFDNIAMDINIEASRGSDVVIPINLTADVSSNEFITFVNYQDSLFEMQEKRQIKELSGFSLNMDLSLNPSARIEIILPEDLGNIQGVGFGDINMNLNRAGNFTMAGDYQVTDGSFLFTVKKVYKKRFDLVEGGTISWSGDPTEGELNMKAVYHVKTSINSLGASQDTSYRSRVPVDCIIGLKDHILNPTVKFSFEFPNSTEEVRQLVFSQIDTTNDAEMARQMLSLLVLNSFSFSSVAGNDNFSSGVSGSSLQLVANQLGSWLSQISNDVDVGIKYRPGGTITSEEVEVALSTQLFDDRVSIDGNFGYQNMNNMPSPNSGASNSNASNIVGDINVEYKIAKDGRFRLKAFNRTNTIDFIDNIAPYTQGLGVFYRKEFNFFKDLFRKSNKNQKEIEVQPEQIGPEMINIKAEEQTSGKNNEAPIQ